MGAYTNPIYPYKAPADLMSTPPQRKPLIIIGAGPVGLAAAIDAVDEGGLRRVAPRQPDVRAAGSDPRQDRKSVV